MIAPCMNILNFAQTAVKAANEGLVTLLPISKRDATNGCMIRFRLGSLAQAPQTQDLNWLVRVFWNKKEA